MPVSYSIDPDLGIVVTVGEGQVTDEDLLAHVQALAKDPEAAGLDELVLVRVDEIRVSADGVRRAGSYMRERGRNAPHKLAIVVPSVAAFGMARLYEAYRERRGVETRVFHDESEARAWMGVA